MNDTSYSLNLRRVREWAVNTPYAQPSRPAIGVGTPLPKWGWRSRGAPGNRGSGARFSPLVVARPPLQAIHHAARLLRAQCFLHRSLNRRPIVGVDVVLEHRRRSVESPWWPAENVFDIARPGDSVGPDLPRPDADLAGF